MRRIDGENTHYTVFFFLKGNNDFCRIEFYKDMLAINCLAATEMCAMVLPKMVGKNKGVVVNISSIGKRPSIMTTVYSACKSYISALSEGLRATYCGSGSGMKKPPNKPILVHAPSAA